MKTRIISESDIPILETRFPKGWFTIYDIKNMFSDEAKRKQLLKLESKGIIESKMGYAEINGLLKKVRIYKKI